MNRSALLFLAVATGLVSVAVLAKPVSFNLPVERVPPELAGPANSVVVANCSGCHSLDYIVTQPRGKGEQFWRDEVTKMITVYKAPTSPQDADAIVKALGRKFG